MKSRILVILTALTTVGPVLLVAQDTKGAKPLVASDVEKLKAEVAQLQDDLAAARVARAQCEMTLGPVEAQVRRQSSDKTWMDLKAEMEKARPGYDCNPRTLECTKKPEPPKAPEKKDQPKGQK